MKTEKTEELMIKWMDGELSSSEKEHFVRLFEEEPELEKELSAMKAMAEAVSKEIPASVEPPYGDFFNSQLMRKVDLEIEAQRPARKAERWWESLRWAWAPAGGLALALAFFAGHRLGNPESSGEVADANQPTRSMEAISLPTVYSAGDGLKAEVIADSDGDVTAIVVEGITAIRDDFDLGSVTTSQTDLPASYVSAEGRRFD